MCISHVGVSASSGITLDGMVSACLPGQVDTRASTGGCVLCRVEVSWEQGRGPRTWPPAGLAHHYLCGPGQHVQCLPSGIEKK